jgi:hypothetical protein
MGSVSTAPAAADPSPAAVITLVVVGVPVERDLEAAADAVGELAASRR